jgi:hypothetical protein
MINFDEFLDLVNHEITSGAKFLWNCYGPNARFIDCNNVTAVYDTKTLNVYAIEINIGDIPYRWIQPEYKELHEYEAESKAVDPDIAYDDVKFVDVSLDEIVEIIGSNKCQN